MATIPNAKVVAMFETALEQARRGEISSAVLLTLNGVGGHTGRWARISSDEDVQAIPAQLKEMEAGMRELLPDAPW